MEKIKNDYSDKSRGFMMFLRIFAVLELFSSGRAKKMLKKESLDVKKLDDTAENEPLQTSKIRKI